MPSWHNFCRGSRWTFNAQCRGDFTCVGVCLYGVGVGVCVGVCVCVCGCVCVCVYVGVCVCVCVFVFVLVCVLVCSCVITFHELISWFVIVYCRFCAP